VHHGAVTRRRTEPATTPVAPPDSPADADEGRLLAALLEAESLVSARMDALARRAQGVSLAQLDILVTVARTAGGALRMGDLAETLVVSRSGVTYRVDVLERRGLVVRAASDADQRETFVRLTDAGRRLVAEAIGQQVRMLAELTRGRMHPGALADTADTLEALAALLRPQPGAPDAVAAP
jgi:DNA-binding MarR family transcriptional regulator